MTRKFSSQALLDHDQKGRPIGVTNVLQVWWLILYGRLYIQYNLWYYNLLWEFFNLYVRFTAFLLSSCPGVPDTFKLPKPLSLCNTLLVRFTPQRMVPHTDYKARLYFCALCIFGPNLHGASFGVAISFLRIVRRILSSTIAQLGGFSLAWTQN